MKKHLGLMSLVAIAIIVVSCHDGLTGVQSGSVDPVVLTLEVSYDPATLEVLDVAPSDSALYEELLAHPELGPIVQGSVEWSEEPIEDEEGETEQLSATVFFTQSFIDCTTCATASRSGVRPCDDGYGEYTRTETRLRFRLSCFCRRCEYRCVTIQYCSYPDWQRTVKTAWRPCPPGGASCD